MSTIRKSNRSRPDVHIDPRTHQPVVGRSLANGGQPRPIQQAAPARSALLAGSHSQASVNRSRNAPPNGIIPRMTLNLLQPPSPLQPLPTAGNGRQPVSSAFIKKKPKGTAIAQARNQVALRQALAAPLHDDGVDSDDALVNAESTGLQAKSGNKRAATATLVNKKKPKANVRSIGASISATTVLNPSRTPQHISPPVAAHPSSTPSSTGSRGRSKASSHEPWLKSASFGVEHMVITEKFFATCADVYSQASLGLEAEGHDISELTNPELTFLRGIPAAVRTPLVSKVREYVEEYGFGLDAARNMQLAEFLDSGSRFLAITTDVHNLDYKARVFGTFTNKAFMNIVRRLLVDGTTGTRALFVVTVEAVAAVAAMVRCAIRQYARGASASTKNFTQHAYEKEFTSFRDTLRKKSFVNTEYGSLEGYIGAFGPTRAARAAAPRDVDEGPQCLSDGGDPREDEDEEEVPTDREDGVLSEAELLYNDGVDARFSQPPVHGSSSDLDLPQIDGEEDEGFYDDDQEAVEGQQGTDEDQYDGEGEYEEEEEDETRYEEDEDDDAGNLYSEGHLSGTLGEEEEEEEEY